MEKKCPICSFPLPNPKHFTCNHIFCPFCYTHSLFSENIRNLQISTREIISICQQCNKGKISLTLQQFSSYFSQNQIPLKNCPKHNKKTFSFCKNCNIHLCEDCFTLFHNDYFKSHEIINMPEIFSLQKKCKKHMKIFEFICFKCKEEICSDCLEKHHMHDIYEINDIIIRAIGTTKFKEYKDYFNYLTQKEISIRDIINSDYNKNIVKIEMIMKNLIKLKENYKKNIENLYKKISEYFFFLKNLYYFYYISMNLNTIKNNVIMKKYVFLMNKNKDNLVNEELLNFFDLNLFSHNSNEFLDKIEENIFFFDKKKPFECKLNKLVFKFKQKFDKNKDSIVDIQNFDNKNVIFATKNGKIFNFSLETFEIINEFKAHDEKISKILIINSNEKNSNSNEKNSNEKNLISIEKNSNEFNLISSSFDKTIKLFTYSNNNFILKHTFKGHKGKITCMILINNNENSSENFFISGSSDNNLKLWSLNEFKCVKTLANGHKMSVNDIIQISNKKIASVSQEKIIIWNLEKFSIEYFFEFDLNVNKMILLEENKILLANENNLGIFNLKNKKISNLKFSKNIEKGEINFLFKMTNLNCFLTCRSENIIEIWNSDLAILSPEKNSCETILYGHKSSVNCAICLENDDFIISGDENGTIFVWENTIVKDFIEDE